MDGMGHFRSRLIPAVLLLAALGVLAGLAGCEPNDWNYILAAPEPVAGLSTTHTGGSDVIQFDYTLPQLAIADIFPDYGFDVSYYYREAAGTAEIYLGREPHDENDMGTPVSRSMNIASAGLTGGSGYVFILYTVDAERQKSTPVESVVITW